MPDYTAIVLVAIVLVLALETLWLRTGIFTSPQYWITLAITVAFQIPVDGYLTRLDAPVVLYADRQTLGVRFPWDIPIEDFGFGFALLTLTILLWCRSTRRGTTR